MKMKRWLQLLLIAALLAVFVQYRWYDAVRTDTDAPVIEIDETQQLEISVQDPKSALLQGVSARDARDGDLTDKLVVESVQLLNDDGLVAVDYAVADKSGNVTKVMREVRYTDYDSPKFSLNQPLIYEEHEEFDIMNDISATDVVDGDIRHRIRAALLTEDSITNTGTHQVYFQVNNSIGDTSELTLPLEVLASDRFDAELTLTDYLIYLSAGAQFQPNAYLNSFIYRDMETSLRYGMPEDFSVSISGSVQTRNPGVYAVTYRVTQILRNAQNPEYDQKITGYSRLIVVVEG